MREKDTVMLYYESLWSKNELLYVGEEEGGGKQMDCLMLW